jgi:hypothetical protein
MCPQYTCTPPPPFPLPHPTPHLVYSQLGLPLNVLSGRDVHVHFPAGAVSKDGPSAGVAIVSALYSVFTGNPVPATAAMTGEITLAGNVCPVGGKCTPFLCREAVHSRTTHINVFSSWGLCMWLSGGVGGGRPCTSSQGCFSSALQKKPSHALNHVPPKLYVMPSRDIEPQVHITPTPPPTHIPPHTHVDLCRG